MEQQVSFVLAEDIQVTEPGSLFEGNLGFKMIMTDWGTTNEEELKNNEKEMIWWNWACLQLHLGGMISSVSARWSSRSARMVFVLVVNNVSPHCYAVVKKAAAVIALYRIFCIKIHKIVFLGFFLVRIEE